MSAESTLVFFGIRFDVLPDEIEMLETNNHPHIRKAREFGLNYYGGNFAEPGEKYFLFIGTKLGVVGAENTAEVRVAPDDLGTIVNETKAKLRRAGFETEPAFFVQWMPDAY